MTLTKTTIKIGEMLNIFKVFNKNKFPDIKQLLLWLLSAKYKTTPTVFVEVVWLSSCYHNNFQCLLNQAAFYALLIR